MKRGKPSNMAYLSQTAHGSERVVLGIDPGSRRTGYAVLHQRGRKIVALDSGVFTLGSRLSLTERLGLLHDKIGKLLTRHSIDLAAVEDVFTHRNARSALALGQARGVALALIGSAEIPSASYPPATVKRAVAGNGRADKQQIQRMVQVLLSLSDLPREDEADALAVALCGCMSPMASRVLRSASGGLPHCEGSP